MTAPGRPPSSALAPRAGRPAALARGFTLVEVLVVMVIVGLTIAGVSLGVDALRGRDTQLAVERLRWVLEATAERAQVRGRPIALELLPDGYRFSALDTDGRWSAFEEPPVFMEKLLPEGVRWDTLRVEGRAAERVVFGSRSPQFELTVRTPEGIVLLAGRATGAVTGKRLGEGGA